MSARSWIAVVAVLATALIVGIGIWLGAAMGVLALGALALVLVLAFLWQSIAALFGQGDRLAEESLWLAVPSGETEQKRAVLRALKDLAFERNVGKVNAEDHALLAARYREEAKRLLRQEDTQAQEWTRLAEAHLAEQHSAEAHAAAADAPSTVGGPARTLLLIVVAGAGLAGILGGMGGMGASTAYAQEAPGGGHTWYQRPADQSVVEAALPIGTLKVELRGAQGQALPQQPMRLITTHASISQGTSTTTRDLESDAAGDAQVEGLGFGSSNEYKVEVLHDGGRFMSAPFQLSDQSGQRVRLHAFKTSTDLRSLLVGMQGSCSLTFKEGKLQVDHLYEMVNLGDHAWVANAPVAVPADAVAITVRSEMATAEFVRQGDGLVLKGTLGPGLGRASFSYQIPLLGSSAQDFVLGVPPRLAQMQIAMEAGPGMALSVADFSPAQWSQSGDGRRILVTQGVADSSALSALRVRIEGLPVPPRWRWLVTGVAAMTVALGVASLLYLQRSQRARAALKEERLLELRDARNALVLELRHLDAERDAGSVGPASYQRMRDEMMRALGRVLKQMETV